MAKKQKKVKMLDKWKKKKFYPVFAPKTFQSAQLGESAAYTSDLLMGRRIHSNLMTLTGNIKRQNVNVKFEIDKIRGDNAYTSLKEIYVIPAAIKRKVRRGKDRIDESIECKTKDDKKIRIKPLVITGSPTSSSVRKDLRKRLIAFLIKTIAARDYNIIVDQIINFRLQIEMKNTLSKIFPVKGTEIRVMKIIDEPVEDDVEVKPVEKKPEAKTEEKPVEEETVSEENKK